MDSTTLSQSLGQKMDTNPSIMDSFSGFSSLDSDKTITDRLEGVLYNVLPSGSKVSIQFCIPVLFHNFIQLLEKEFVNSTWSVDNKFCVSSHIQGRKVIITAYEAEKTIEVSGPGHKIWKDIAFKRIATTLFTRFMKNLGADLQSSVNGTSVSPQLTSTPAVSRPSQASVPVITQQETTIPVVDKMSAIFELIAYHSQMISSLQDQLTNLTSEVIKLQEQASQRKTPQSENQSDVESGMFRAPSIISIDSTPCSAQASSTPKKIQKDDCQMPSKSKMQMKKANQYTNKPKNTQIKAKKAVQRKSGETPKSTKSLIIGDSIIKGINEKGLNSNIHCHGISGATVETVLDQIQLFDLKNFSTIIISVGGNDISNGSNLEYVEEKYDQLLRQIQAGNPDCQKVICTICPRQDCNTTEMNGLLRLLSIEHGATLVEMEKHFCGLDGNPTLRYYGKDNIHLSKSGVRRFLDAIEKTYENLKLVNNFDLCVFGKPVVHQNTSQNHQRKVSQTSRWGNRFIPRNINPVRDRTQKCDKCGETNHSTFDCKHKEQIKCYSCGFFGHKQLRCLNK